jgi:hypothetical protein
MLGITIVALLVLGSLALVSDYTKATSTTSRWSLPFLRLRFGSFRTDVTAKEWAPLRIAAENQSPTCFAPFFSPDQNSQANGSPLDVPHKWHM